MTCTFLSFLVYGITVFSLLSFELKQANRFSHSSLETHFAQVTKAIEYTKKTVEKGEVKNPAGYLNKMVRETDFVNQEAEIVKEKAQK